MGTNEDIIKPYRYPFLVLAIMYLIFWKKKNISVKMLVKAVIAQFLIAVILVKVPAGRYVVSRVVGCSDQRHQLRSGRFKLCVRFTGRQHGCHRIRFLPYRSWATLYSCLPW